MPAKQSIPSGSIPVRNGSSENGQYPSIAGGVRRLLGLPRGECGAVSAAVLTAPPRGHHYGGAPWPAREENEESFREITEDEELIEAGGCADPQSDFSRPLPRDDASSPRIIPGNPAGQRSPSLAIGEHRERTSFVVPGVSTNRTEFRALSHTSDTTTITQAEQSQELGPDKMAPVHALASLPRPPETAMFDSELLSRLERLFSAGAKPRIDSETRRGSSIALSLASSLVEQKGVTNGEQGDTDVARSLARLQRVVSELSATVSSQVARNRNESQAQQREPKTPPLQRTVIIKRSEASTVPRAFWERSRLGRFYLKTRR